MMRRCVGPWPAGPRPPTRPSGLHANARVLRSGTSMAGADMHEVHARAEAVWEGVGSHGFRVIVTIPPVAEQAAAGP